MSRVFAGGAISLLLHLSVGVALGILGRTAPLMPPRVLYVVLPETDAVARAMERDGSDERLAEKETGPVRAPKAEPRHAIVPLGRADAGPAPVRTEPQGTPPTARAETASSELEPQSASARPVQDGAPSEPSRAPSRPAGVPRALAAETWRPATGSAERSGSATSATEGHAEGGSIVDGGAPRVASMGSQRAGGSPSDGQHGAGAGSAGSGPADDGRGGESLAALPPSGPMSLAIPRYSDNAKPAYPWRARLRGEQGTVLLLVRVSEEGRAGEVRVSRSSGSEALDEAALTAVRRWIFHPARRGDRPVDMWVQVPIHFRLKD